MTSTLKVRVAARRNEAVGIDVFRLESVDGSPLPGFAAGAHVDVHLPGAGVGGQTLIRPYSLCNAPPAAGAAAAFYELGVQREPQSRGGSAAMHDTAQPGAVLTIGRPRNFFPLVAADPAAPQDGALLLAGGIGITPILAMAEALHAQGRPFALHHAARSADRAPFGDRIAAAPWAAQARRHLDDGAPDQRLDLPALLADPQPGRQLYVCGPQGFMDVVLSAARAAGWSESQLHWESFGGAPSAAVPGPAEGPGADTAPGHFTLQIGRGGRIIPVAPDQTAAQALQAAGLPLMTSCEQGVCGTCLTRVLDGVPDHRDQYLTPEEQEAGDQFLPCCSRAKTPCLVIELA